MKLGQILGRSWRLAMYMTGLSWLLTVLLKWINIPVIGWNTKYVSVSTAAVVDINLKNELLSQGLAPEVGGKVIELIGKIPYFDLMTMITLFFGFWVTVAVGMWIVEKVGEKLFNFIKNPAIKRNSAIMFYGLLVTWGILALWSGLGWNIIPAIALYYTGLSLLLGMIIKFMPSVGRWL